MTNQTLASVPDETRVLKCETTADFLAALPELAGFTAPNSIFIVFFSGKRTSSAARVDLPPSEEPRDTRAFLDFVSAVLHKAGAAGNYDAAPALAITCEQTFADAGGIPWRRLARRLERRLNHERIRLRELCCLAPDGWVSYLDPAAPLTGRPLSEIDESPITLAARVRGESTPDLSEIGLIPAPSPTQADALKAELSTILPFITHAEGTNSPPRTPLHNPPTGFFPLPSWFADTAEVTAALRDEDSPLSTEMKARLVRSVAAPDRWILIALGILTRPEFPCELAQEMSPQAFTGLAIDVDAEDKPNLEPGWSIRRLLSNICFDFTDRKRLPSIQRKLLEVISETPAPDRPGLLALSAWMWWMSGIQTVAHRHIGEALKIDPEHGLTQMISRLSESPIYNRFLESAHAA